MANTNRINGFRPVKHITGAPYNGQANIYEVPAGEAVPVFVGDPVVLSNSNATAGVPAVEALAASAAGDVASGVIVGVVVGILNTKFDPVDGKMSTGSVSLDVPIYRPASTKQFVLVADSPDLIFEGQADAAVAAESVGLNAGLNVGTHDTTTGTSVWQVDASSANTTNTLPVQIVGFPKRVDNEINATYNRVWFRINTHAYANGATGV